MIQTKKQLNTLSMINSVNIVTLKIFINGCSQATVMSKCQKWPILMKIAHAPSTLIKKITKTAKFWKNETTTILKEQLKNIVWHFKFSKTSWLISYISLQMVHILRFFIFKRQITCKLNKILKIALDHSLKKVITF